MSAPRALTLAQVPIGPVDKRCMPDMGATSRRPLSDRAIAAVTLMDLPAPAAVAVIVALTALSWLAAYFLGGGTNVAPHWFYIPVFLAGLRFGPFGALVTALISMFVAGPLLPADVATNTPQALSDWVSRGIFFVLIGQFVTALFSGVRRMSLREAGLETKVEQGTVELRDREARFSALVQSSSDVVTIVDRDATILFQSPSVARVLGWDSDSVLGTNLLSAIHPTDQPVWRTIVEFLIDDSGSEMVAEWRVRHGDGSWRYLQSNVTNLFHEPSVGGLVLNSRDITDQKNLEEQLRHQAFHDPLTGLANRALFSEHLEQAVRRRGRLGGGLALLFVDLDSFKAVNDLHGHANGDELLKQVAARLRATCRDADAIARLGGDEFAVLFEALALGSDPSSAAERLIGSFAKPFRVQGVDVFVTASIGVALDESATESGEDLLRNADLAMYAAKTKNKGSYEFFSLGMHSLILQRMQLDADLRRALDQNEFEVYYQPIIDSRSGTIGGVEALIRWNHPERGLVMPNDFIGAAESSGVIVQIGDWMLNHACAEFATLTRGVAGGDSIGLSINLSTRQLSDPHLLDTVRRAVASAGLNTERLTLEITETTVMEDTENAVRVLTELRSIGAKIAIDDFGTGYSSLSLLANIPVDTLKIDRVFITDIARRPEPARLVRAILTLASDLGLHTVAEGVEELAQHRLLQELGCDTSQGYYFARPQPAGQLLELLRGGF